MDTRPVDSSFLLSFLQTNKLAILSTVNSLGKPDAAPIYYVVKYTFDIYFLTPATSKKSQNMAHQPEVVLTITDESQVETMQIRGVAQEEQNIMENTLEDLAKKFNYQSNFIQTLPVYKHKNQPIIIMKVDPYEIRFRRYGLTELTEKVMRKSNGNWELM